jgi:hypothetical protein
MGYIFGLALEGTGLQSITGGKRVVFASSPPLKVTRSLECIASLVFLPFKWRIEVGMGYSAATASTKEAPSARSSTQARCPQ